MKQFQILVPPGWFMVDLRDDLDAQIERFVSLRLAGVPRDRARSVSPTLRKSLAEATRSLSDGGAVGLTLPVEVDDALAATPMAVYMPLAVPDGQDPIDVLLAVAASDMSAKTVDVGDLVSIRLSEDVDATASVQDGLSQAANILNAPIGQEAVGMTATRHHVRYLMGDPGDAERWVDVAFSVTSTSLSGSVDLAEVLIELFDETIQSFRWLS